MEHLIVGGTGAVGATWAYHLHRAGDSVSIFVRDKYKAEVKSNGNSLTIHDLALTQYLMCAAFGVLVGIVAHFVNKIISFTLLSLVIGTVVAVVALPHLRQFLPRPSVRKVPVKHTVSSASEAAASGTIFDIVWVCLATDQFFDASFIVELAAAFPEATFVSVGPSASSYDVLMSFLQKAGDSVEKAQSRILLSTIPVMAYQTPLEGETFAATAPVPGASPKTVAAGIAVFTPKGAPAVITGLPSTAARARAAAGSLSEGGMTAMRFKGEAGLQSTIASEMWYVFILFLESRNWSLFNVVKDSLALAPVIQDAATVATLAPYIAASGSKNDDVVSSSSSSSSSTGAAQLSSGQKNKIVVLSYALLLIPLIVATIGRATMIMDLEVFVKYHFTKVGKQMLMGARSCIERGKARGVPTPAFTELADKVEVLRQAAPGSKKSNK